MDLLCTVKNIKLIKYFGLHQIHLCEEDHPDLTFFGDDLFYKEKSDAVRSEICFNSSGTRNDEAWGAVF